MKLYKVRRKSDGLFAVRLFYHIEVVFNKSGGFFSLGELEEFFNNFSERKNHINRFKNCEIVEFKMVETEHKVNPAQLAYEKFMFERI